MVHEIGKLKMEEKILERDWYYKGIVYWNQGKDLGHCFVKLNELNEIIENFSYIDKKLDLYVIGGNYHIEVTRNEDGNAKTIYKRILNEGNLIDFKIVQKWRIESLESKEKQKEFRNSQKLIKESHNIENMKLKDLKDYTNKSWQNRDLVLAWILKYLQ